MWAKSQAELVTNLSKSQLYWVQFCLGRWTSSKVCFPFQVFHCPCFHLLRQRTHPWDWTLDPVRVRSASNYFRRSLKSRVSLLWPPLRAWKALQISSLPCLSFLSTLGKACFLSRELWCASFLIGSPFELRVYHFRSWGVRFQIGNWSHLGNYQTRRLLQYVQACLP